MTPPYKPPSAYTVQQVVGAYQRARAWLLDDPEAYYDESVITGLLGPETGDVRDLLDRTLRAAAQAKRMEDAAEAQIAALKPRKDRFGRRFDVLKQTAFAIMQALEMRSHELPDITASIRKGSASVQIIDETKVEDRFMRIVPESKAPDKVKIREALTKDGEVLTYAVMSNAPPYLSLTSK